MDKTGRRTRLSSLSSLGDFVGDILPFAGLILHGMLILLFAFAALAIF